MRKAFLGFLVLYSLQIFSQETKLPYPMIEVDSLYREDQFYFTFTHSMLLQTPSGVSTNKFSPGFKLGFLRDFPLNKRRNKAIAPGIGLSYTKYFQNLFVLESNGQINYSTNSIANSYDRNKLDQVYVDFPIEFRWRTSVANSHKFWRVYSGLQFSYLVYSRSLYEDQVNRISVSNNKDLNKIQAGLYLVAGNNTWNFYVFYGLLPLFDSDARVNGERIGMHAFHFGMMFYIL